MLVSFKLSAVLNSQLNLPPKRLGRDSEYIGRLCHSFERFCCLHLQGGIDLENVDSILTYGVKFRMAASLISIEGYSLAALYHSSYEIKHGQDNPQR